MFERRFDGLQRLPAIMDAPERLEPLIVKALHTDGKAINTVCDVTGKAGRLVRARVGFQRNLSVFGKGKTLAQTVHKRLKARHRHQARRTATEKDARNGPATGQCHRRIYVL